MNYETTVETRGDADASAPAEYRPGMQMDADGRDNGRGSLKKYLLILLLLAALLAGAYYFFKGDGGAGDFAPREDGQAPAITVDAPGRATISGEIVATGTLAARRAMPVGVVGEGGRVISVPVEAGDWVRAGQTLVVLDRSVQSQQAVSSAAQIEVSRADAQLAQANLDRASQLVERGFISKADIDRLTATRDAAAARVKVSQAQYRELLARNARLNIVAPAAGLVLERNVEPGQVVSPGAGALFTIAKGGEMEMLAELGETDLASIPVGVSAQVVPVGTQQNFTGQVWQVSPVINEQNRQGVARIALAYAEGLRPGGFATATIASGTIVAPMLPESAILSDDKGSFVYIVGKDNKTVRQPVKTGMITSEGIAIVEGLSGSELVVMRAGGFLNEGETIRPMRQGKTSDAGAPARSSGEQAQ